MVLVTLFIFGIIIGSFLNVVTMRYELGGSIVATKLIGGRSHCPQCNTTLHWYELIPIVSFAVQGRKCRHCEYRLSWQYPVVELLTGVLTAAIPLFLYERFSVAAVAAGDGPLFWFYALTGIWLLVAYTFVVLAVIDLKHTIIPDMANLLLGVLGIAIVALKALCGSFLSYSGSFLGSYTFLLPVSDSVWIQALIAAGLGAFIFGGIIALTRGRGMGLGDLKLVIPLGLLMGWPDIILVIALSFIIGAIISLCLLAARKKSFKDGVPFGPFLVASVFVVMFFGQTIMNWYFTLL